MGKVGRVIAGAVLIGVAVFVPGLGTVLGMSVQGLLASAGLGLLSSALRKPLAGSQQGIELNTADPQQALPLVYGQARVGLRIVDRQVDGDDNAVLYLVGALCVGSEDGSGIQAIDEIYFDNKLAFNAAGTAESWLTPTIAGVPFVCATVTKYLGTDAQTVDPVLAAKFPDAWPATSRGRGIAYVVLKLHYLQSVFPAGVPNVTVVVRGNRLYDPRDTTTHWSSTPALAIRDYLASSRYGAGRPDTELDDTAISAEANYHEEAVSVPAVWPAGGTTTIDRFGASGWLDTDQTLEQNLAYLTGCCRGDLVYQGGRFRPYTRRATSPAAFTLDESNLIGDWSFGLPGLRTRKNVGRATYLDHDRNYQPLTQQWPRPEDANNYLTADAGFESPLELELPLTPDPYHAEQLLMVQVRETRNAIVAEVTATEAALQLAMFDVVSVTHSTPGWSAKAFWVVGMALLPNATVRLALLEYDASAYTLDSQSQIVGAPDSNLPNPHVCQSPSGLTLTAGDSELLRYPDGSWDQLIRVDWTASPDPFLDYYELSLRKTGDPGYLVARKPLKDDTSAWLGAVFEGIGYDVQLVAVNVLGVRSTAVTASVTPAPTVRRFASGFLDDFSFAFPGRRWVQKAGSGAATRVETRESQVGGFTVECAGYVWYEYADNIPFDPTLLYALIFRVRNLEDPSNGAKKCWLGLAGIGADGSTYVNVAGADSYSSQHYIAARDQVLAVGPGWTQYVAFLRGTAGGACPLSADSLTQSGLGVLTALTDLADGDTATACLSFDAASAGATLTADFGSTGRNLQSVIVYLTAAGSTAQLAVESSADGSAWTQRGTTTTVSASGANTISFTAPTTRPRYWRLRLVNTPGAGPDVTEVEFIEAGTPGQLGTDVQYPAAMRTGTKFVRPLFIANYPDGVGGRFQLDAVVMSMPAGVSPDVFADEARRMLETLYGADGQLKDTVVQQDGAGNRVMVRGRQSGTCRNGAAVAFNPPFSRAPTVRLAGGIYSEPRSKWGTQAQADADPPTGTGAPLASVATVEQFAAENLSASGFTAKGRLVQSAASLTLRSNSFDAGTLSSTASTPKTAPLTSGPAYNGNYWVTLTGSIRIVMPSKYEIDAAVSVRVTIESSASGTFADAVERAARVYSGEAEGYGDDRTADLSDEIGMAVSGLTAASKFRMKIVSVDQTGNQLADVTIAIDPGVVKFYTASGTSQYASKTPDAGQLLSWEAEVIV